MRVIDCVQGGDDWIAARIGKVTASNFAKVLARGEGKVRDEYMRKVAGEIITGEQMSAYRNEAMDDGNAIEPEARSAYSMIAGVDVQQVGFVVHEDGTLADRVGASPDGLIGNDGMVEIKRQAPHLLIDRIRYDSGDVHMAQSQGNLWIAKREWIDLVVYYPKMPLYRKRIRRDENYIQRLRLAVEVFIEELDALVDKVRAY